MIVRALRARRACGHTARMMARRRGATTSLQKRVYLNADYRYMRGSDYAQPLTLPNMGVARRNGYPLNCRVPAGRGLDKRESKWARTGPNGPEQARSVCKFDYVRARIRPGRHHVVWVTPSRILAISGMVAG